MIGPHVEALELIDLGRSPPPQPSAGPFGRRARQASEDSRAAAAERLAAWLPAAVVGRLGNYFDNAAVHSADAPGANGTPPFDLESFLVRLCATPRTVYAIGGDSGAAQVELRTLEGACDGTQYGTQAEPDSPRVLFAPGRLERALADGLSLGVRQFDRQFTEWAPLVDDIAAVSGADIFTKLFVAGGLESVTDWHRDQSDVVVTMLAGTKRFSVAPPGVTDESGPPIEVTSELAPDRALLLPRSRLHCATPVGDTSALLSIGIMRHADWMFRSVIPTHLGFSAFPGSTGSYRLMLRPHVPAALAPRHVDAGDRWRTRLPGGFVVVDETPGSAFLIALGRRYQISAPALRALLAIHAGGVRVSEQIVDEAGLSELEAREIIASLVAAELVAPC